MTEYSGRTSAHMHKFDDWKDHPGPFAPAISQMTVFNAQWTDCPIEVENEVKRMWGDHELGNDSHYDKWDRDADHYTLTPDGEISDVDSTFALVYPLIDEYLMSHGISKCLIHWWW